MKFLLSLLLILSLALSSCSFLTPARKVASDNFSERLSSFQDLSLEILVWRVEAQKLLGTLDAKTRKGKALKGEDINHILTMMKLYLEYYDRMMEEVSSSKAFVSDAKNENSDVRTGEGQEYLFHLKKTLAAELILYDNYLTVINPLDNNKKLRRLVRWDNEQIERKAYNIAVDFGGKKNRKLFSKLLDIHFQELNEREENKASYDASLERDFVYLDQIIDQSVSMAYFERDNGKIVSGSKSFWRKLGDMIDHVADFCLYVGSKIFGNTAGMFQSRMGKLYTMPQTEQNAVTSSLQPLDLLLEATPFRLTAKFIPGYYGHVAIWIGNEAQLRELGIWDHPVVSRFHKEIGEGRMIVEALRSGVEINSFQHFLNIDDLLVLRPRVELSLEEKREYIVKALEQVGKAYDFNFDVESEATIVCSELAYVVYEKEDWPTSRMLGRFTISPDDVAGRALNGPFLPQLMYKDGKRVEGELESALAKNLKK